MTVDMCDEWHHQDVACEVNPQDEFFADMVEIAYSGVTQWTKKDRLEYNRIFEGL